MRQCSRERFGYGNQRFERLFFSTLRQVKSAFNKPRDPKRIDKVLTAIKKLWEKNPDQRLGQLLVNAKIIATNDSGEHRGELFNYEDTDLLKAVRAYGRPRRQEAQARRTKSPKKSLGNRKKGKVRRPRHTE